MFRNDIDDMVNNILSSLILILFFYGRSLHSKNRDLHIKIMYLVVALDLCLVLYLAAFRDALSKISPDMSPILIIHVFFAVSTVLLYLFITYFGIKLSRGEEAARANLKRVDKVIVVFRVMTLVTSFALIM